MRRLTRRQKRSIAWFKERIPGVDEAFDLGVKASVYTSYQPRIPVISNNYNPLIRGLKNTPSFLIKSKYFSTYIDACHAYSKGINEGKDDRADSNMRGQLSPHYRYLILIPTGREIAQLNLLCYYSKRFYRRSYMDLLDWQCDPREFRKLVEWCHENITSPWAIHRGYFYFSDRDDHVLFRLAM